MSLRDNKLSRLGRFLFATWLCFLVMILISMFGSGTVKNTPFLIALLGFLLVLLVPTLDLLFAYSGFSFAYEGRRIPAMLFTGIRTLLVIALPVLLISGTIAASSPSSASALSSLNVPQLPDITSALSNINLQNAGTVAIVGTILLMVGIVLNGLLFCAFAFVGKNYNGKAFMIMSIIFSAMEALGVILFFVSIVISISKVARVTNFIDVGNLSAVNTVPWYGWVMMVFALGGEILKYLSFIVGYKPGTAAKQAAPSYDSYGGYGGY